MNTPPTGTITFLFTDIEGSTKRWEEHPQQMQAALKRHNAILSSAIEAEGGHIFKTMGDAFCAAFHSPHDALNAAIAAQHSLHNEQWPDEIGTVTVRMALHTGAVDEQNGDYFGQPVNRVARLLSAGHGGQVLLSEVTHGLLRDNLPPHTSIFDLGEHRLKDLIRPEHVFQVVPPLLSSDFPSLNTLNAKPNNLPMQHTEFIGREKEVASVVERLRQSKVHLLTLTGPGGTGKTRLALQAGAELLDDFSDGVWFVNLASITEYGLVVSTIAQTMGVKEEGNFPILDTLCNYFRTKGLLLVLDNFEQVVDAAPLVNKLIEAAPNLKVLATSRVPLRVQGEKEYPVLPLSLPDLKHLPPLDRLTQFEAVRLFIERATDIKPDFQVNNDNAPAVAEICTRLDGLPLAIELAAARIKMLPPEAMLARLQSRLKLLTGGARDLPRRQQTLRGAIEWSYDLLNQGEQQLFRRLAVFVGGRTLEAVEAVCNAEGDLEIDVIDGVQSLVDKNLIRQDESAGVEPRFVMLETINEYSREKLVESNEDEVTLKQHAQYFLVLAESAEREIWGQDQLLWLDRLEADHDNLRAALRWALDNKTYETNELGLRIVGALMRFWIYRSYLSEGFRWTIAMLEETSSVQPTRARAKALYAAGVLAWRLGDSRARPLTEESMAIYREVGDVYGHAATLRHLGLVTLSQEGNLELAQSLVQESIPLLRVTGNKPELALALLNLGIIKRYLGEAAKSRALLEEGLSVFRELGGKWAIALALREVAREAMLHGRYSEGQSLIEESIVIWREVGTRHEIADSLNDLGELARRHGDYKRALTLYKEGLTIYREIAFGPRLAIVLANAGFVLLHLGESDGAYVSFAEGLHIAARELKHKGMTACCLVGIAGVAVAQRSGERAARLIGVADALLEASGYALEDSDQADYELIVTTSRAALGEAVWQQAWLEGRAMSMEDAMQYALEIPAHDQFT